MSVPGGAATARTVIRPDDGVPLDIPRVPAREAAERELSGPAYRGHEPNLLQRALDRFWQWVDDLFGSASDAAPGGPLGLLVIVLLVVGVAAALGWRLGTPRRIPGTTGGSLFADGPRGASEHRRSAETHAGAGRWNEALQERMRALVRALEERTLLEPRPGRTADEAAAEAGRPLPDHAARLRTAAREFDEVTYGGRTADQHAYLRLRQLDLDLEQARPLPGHTAGRTSG